MRFARVQCDSDAVPAGLELLATGCDLDLLQLDYSRAVSMAIEPGVPVELPEWPRAFADTLRTVGQVLFLEPHFRVIASAGWSDAYACVEKAAEAMVATGCGDMPISAVRGSNLLPILDMLASEGVDLKNVETGAKWRDLREPVLAADLQLGAGPIATALAEEARVVVAGWYDPVSPLIAAAVREFGWTWREYHRLAGAAVAAKAVAWSDWEGAGESLAGAAFNTPWQVRHVELTEAAETTVHLAGATSAAAADRLQTWLAATEEGAALDRCADVRVDASQLRTAVCGAQQIAVEGAAGAKGDGSWLLEVLYQTGFAAEAMIELDATADMQLRKHIVKAARKQLQCPGDAGTATIKELQPLGSTTGPAWIHLAYHSKSPKACRQFADLALKLAAAYRPWLRLAAGAPAVHVHCGQWLARVPRDAVDIAVETRPAKEWM